MNNMQCVCAGNWCKHQGLLPVLSTVHWEGSPDLWQDTDYCQLHCKHLWTAPIGKRYFLQGCVTCKTLANKVGFCEASVENTVVHIKLPVPSCDSCSGSYTGSMLPVCESPDA